MRHAARNAGSPRKKLFVTLAGVSFSVNAQQLYSVSVQFAGSDGLAVTLRTGDSLTAY